MHYTFNRVRIIRYLSIFEMVVGTNDGSPNFANLNELASETNGGQIVFATDDWFACAENLLKDTEPVFKPDLYTDFGKWMDGWETRRRRCQGHDWAVIALKKPSTIMGVCVDTAYFTGNYAPRFSIQAAKLTDEEAKLFPKRECKIGTAADKSQMEQVQRIDTQKWETLVPMTNLRAGYEETRLNYFNVFETGTWTHLRLNMFPDGGIARLRVFGFVTPDWEEVNSDELIDLMSAENGTVCESYSNAHYGHPRNLIKTERGINMGDGWETARRLDRPPILEADDSGVLQVPGNEWAIFRLGHVGEIHSIEVDTNFFKGNFPDSIKIEGVLADPNQDSRRWSWKTIMTPKKLSPHKQHFYSTDDLLSYGPITHVKLTMAPDGGISRVRMLGHISHVSELLR
ncbi:allantoicase-like [Neodiprion pinetum]|uniref:Allantoate amidinohydrolase n=1 Tax=Neodiprion lecontei TaxID=441921 RepID=A0A6J0C2Y7_NEOLC|nr:allantoicase [Neodiprion lecontei]XP_046493118.1 allantoicase-like [Neodiprion pinetum]